MDTVLDTVPRIQSLRIRLELFEFDVIVLYDFDVQTGVTREEAEHSLASPHSPLFLLYKMNQQYSSIPLNHG